MKRKFILLPITLTTLAPAISLVGCGDPDTPEPPEPIPPDQYEVILQSDNMLTISSSRGYKNDDLICYITAIEEYYEVPTIKGYYEVTIDDRPFADFTIQKTEAYSKVIFIIPKQYLGDRIIIKVKPFLHYLTFSALSNTDIYYSKIGTPKTSISYLLNNQPDFVSWNDGENNKIELKKGDRLFVKSDHWNNLDTDSHITFKTTNTMPSTIKASGNITSLLNYNTENIPEYCFYQLFFNMNSLASTPEIPIEQGSVACFRDMFYYCSGLKEASLLVTHPLYQSFNGMFDCCTQLKVRDHTPNGHKIVFCDFDSSLCAQGMFQNTAGEFTKMDLDWGKTYYWYE